MIMKGHWWAGVVYYLYWDRYAVYQSLKMPKKYVNCKCHDTHVSRFQDLRNPKKTLRKRKAYQRVSAAASFTHSRCGRVFSSDSNLCAFRLDWNSSEPTVLDARRRSGEPSWLCLSSGKCSQPNSCRKAARTLLTLPEKDERRVFEGKCADYNNDYNNQNF